MTSLQPPRYTACIYPGTYVPKYEFRSIPREQSKILKEFPIKSPLIGLTDRPDRFEIELNLPDLKRESFHITLEGQSVHIDITLPEQTFLSKKEGKSTSQTYCKDVVLPPNADTGFGKATYENGKLRLYFPKTKNIHLTEVNQLVVY